MAFLEIVTRHLFSRPKSLARCEASVMAQTCEDFEHTVLIDEVGQGVGHAQAILHHYAPYLAGEYIWLLDDDDVCVRDSLVGELKQIAEQYDPDVIMLRMDHGGLGVLPDAASWERRPKIGRIGCSAFVVRREVFVAHSVAWLSARYASDYDFIDAVFDGSPSVYWHNVIASRVGRRSMGKGEDEGLQEALA